jgi:hypothetical protein
MRVVIAGFAGLAAPSAVSIDATLQCQRRLAEIRSAPPRRLSLRLADASWLLAHHLAR